MSPLLPEADVRRARIRAAAAAIADAPRAAHRFSPGDRSTTLRRSPRRRLHAPRSSRPRSQPARRAPRRLRRRFAVAFGILQLIGVAVLLLIPGLRVHTVAVSGDRLLTDAAIRAAAKVPTDSVFLVDPDAIRKRVESLPWVRSAQVSTELPSTVNIAVTEWNPVLRLFHGGSDVFIAPTGATVPSTAVNPGMSRAVPVVVDDRANNGSNTPDPTLVALMEDAVHRFPTVFSCGVVGYRWDKDGVFSIWTACRWSVVIGHLETPDAVQAIPGQLAAVAALRSQLNFAHPNFGYVDAENPQSLAVGGKPGVPDDLTAAVKRAFGFGAPPPPPAKSAVPLPTTLAPVVASASAAPSPTPTPAPLAPSAPASPTPYVLTLPRPTPHS